MDIKSYVEGSPLSDYYQKVNCFGRTKIRFLTNNLKFASEKARKGWFLDKTPEGFYLEAPEVWLIEISEPTKVTFFSNNPVDNYAYFLYLKNKKPEELISLLKSINDVDIFLSQGNAIDTEIRIILDDRKEGQRLRIGLYSKFLQDVNYKKFIEKSRGIIGETRSMKIERNKKISDYSPKIRRFFYKIKENYSFVNLENRALYSSDFISGLNTQIESLFNFADLFVFIPWGCFKYIGNFITEKTVNKVMLWEFHMSDFRDHQHRFNSQNLKNKQVILLDKSYTGGTLDRAAEAIKKEGGNPIKVALFPKSKMAVKKADYIVFLDKVLKASEVDVSSPRWYDVLYKKVLSI